MTYPQQTLPEPYASEHPTSTPMRASGGGTAWGMGFLAYIPIPIIGQLIGGVVMAIVAASQRKRGGLVGTQGRNAANWGITYVVVTVVCLLTVLLLGMLSNSMPDQRHVLTGIALTVLGVWLIGVNVTHLVVCITGLVHANQLREFRCPLAVPFLRN